MPTDIDGFFRFATIKPGRVPGTNGALQAPHIAVSIFARGLLKRLVTRIYFPEAEGNADDPVLALVPAERRSTLIAKAVPGKAGVLEWNIVIQGKANGQGETLDEVRRDLAEAIKLLLEVQRESALQTVSPNAFRETVVVG